MGPPAAGIREDEDAIRSLGKNVFAIKMQALIIGGLFEALGGMLYVLPSSVQPDSMGRSLTFFCYTALLIGRATVFGPVLGSVIFYSARILIKGIANVRARQHHERPADRAVLLHRRRCRADAHRDLPTARNPRQQESSGSMSEPDGGPHVHVHPNGVEPGRPPPGGPSWAASSPRRARQADSILVVDNIVRQFGGMTAVDVNHLEVQRGIITALIGPQRCRQDDVLQPDHRVRQADLGQDGRPLVLRRGQARQDVRVQRREGGAWSGPSSSPRR